MIQASAQYIVQALLAGKTPAVSARVGGEQRRGHGRPILTLILRADYASDIPAAGHLTHGRIANLNEVLGVLHWEYADRLSLRIVDFAALSFDEQVQIGHSTDLLIGTHGVGLTNMLWMVPGSAVVEISTSYGERKNQHYRNMAGFMRHSYHRVEGLVPLLGSVGTVELSRLRIAMDSALRSLELPKMIN
jgi:hypothetical protein